MKNLQRQRLEFNYTISDERLIAYSKVPLLERLKWLNEIREFTLMTREAPRAPSVDNSGA